MSIKTDLKNYNGLVLSLFPGIGLLDVAFEQCGFCVVRGPDLIWGGDIRKFHPPENKFDGIIGGPLCQAFSQLRFMVKANGYKLADNLIPEFERCVNEARPKWFLMENVKDAPKPNVEAYYIKDQLIRDVWVGGDTSRLRRFSFGSILEHDFEIETLALHRPDLEPSVLASGSFRSVPVKIGGNGKLKKTARTDLKNKISYTQKYFRSACKLQGLSDDFDIPAFTVKAKGRAIGEGVPIPMGIAVAKAVIRVIRVLNYERQKS